MTQVHVLEGVDTPDLVSLLVDLGGEHIALLDVLLLPVELVHLLLVGLQLQLHFLELLVLVQYVGHHLAFLLSVLYQLHILLFYLGLVYLGL